MTASIWGEIKSAAQDIIALFRHHYMGCCGDPWKDCRNCKGADGEKDEN